MNPRPPLHKRTSHHLKRALYRAAHLDGWLDRWAPVSYTHLRAHET